MRGEHNLNHLFTAVTWTVKFLSFFLSMRNVSLTFSLLLSRLYDVLRSFYTL